MPAMKRLLPLALLALAACTQASDHKPPVTPPDAGVPLCGASACADDQVCQALESAPATPACVAYDDCRAVPREANDLVATALQATGRDSRCSATIPEDYLPALAPDNVKADPWRLAHFGPVHHEPLRFPGWADRMAESFPRPSQANAVSGSILEAAARLGVTVSAERPTYDPAAATPLERAVSDLVLRRGGQVNAAALAADAADVPAEVQQRVASLIVALDVAAQARDQAFSKVGDLQAVYDGAPALIMAANGVINPGDEGTRQMLLQGIDWRALYQGAHDLAAAIEDSPIALSAGATGFAFDQPTPLGRIIIGDAGKQTFDEDGGPVAMIVDLGGDDTYLVPAGATDGVAMGAALVVDAGGNDTYAYVEKKIALDNTPGRAVSDDGGRVSNGQIRGASLSDHPRQGAGRCGIGLAFDLAGDDQYRSLRMSQGFAALGVGVLYDAAGNDKYDAEIGSQGSALFGIGLAIDVAGDDRRYLYAMGQGFGFAAGFGALLDGTGNDEYLANGGNPDEGGDPLYYTPQMANRANSSFVQGAGFGRRDDSGATAMSGGIGLIADFAGDDHYQASVFGQGTGYWFGTGVMYDLAGDDRIDGKYYVQGSAAHFALAFFHDRGGNDAYNQNMSYSVGGTSMGVGHDWSIGYLIDDAGNDKYRGPGLSLGSGNACGWGVLADRGGDDTYSAPGTTMGSYGYGDSEKCSYGRGATVGLLIDAGGTDTYEISGEKPERNDQTTLAQTHPTADAKGAAIDGTGAILFLP